MDLDPTRMDLDPTRIGLGRAGSKARAARIHVDPAGTDLGRGRTRVDHGRIGLDRAGTRASARRIEANEMLDRAAAAATSKTVPKNREDVCAITHRNVPVRAHFRNMTPTGRFPFLSSFTRGVSAGTGVAKGRV